MQKETSIEFIKKPNTQKIKGVRVVVRQVKHVSATDGSFYLLDYGILEVLHTTEFSRSVLYNAPLIKETVSQYRNQYPDASYTIA